MNLFPCIDRSFSSNQWWPGKLIPLAVVLFGPFLCQCIIHQESPGLAESKLWRLVQMQRFPQRLLETWSAVCLCWFCQSSFSYCAGLPQDFGNRDFKLPADVPCIVERLCNKHEGVQFFYFLSHKIHAFVNCCCAASFNFESYENWIQYRS